MQFIYLVYFYTNNEQELSYFTSLWKYQTFKCVVVNCFSPSIDVCSCFLNKLESTEWNCKSKSIPARSHSFVSFPVSPFISLIVPRVATILVCYRKQSYPSDDISSSPQNYVPWEIPSAPFDSRGDEQEPGIMAGSPGAWEIFSLASWEILDTVGAGVWT